MKSIQNTNLNIGLISTPVKIFAASTKERDIGFNLCGPKGEVLEQVYRVKDVEPIELVDRDNMGRSFEGRLVSQTELERIKEASLISEDGRDLKQIHVERFIPLDSVPFERATSFYFIGPDLKKGSAEPLLLIIEAMKKKKAAAVAKVVLRDRQKCFVLFVKDDLLYAVALTFHAALHEPEMSELTQDIKVKRPLVKMATELIEAQMDPDAQILDEMEDTFITHKRRLIEQSQDGEIVVTEPKKGNGQELLDALQGSIDQARKKVGV